MRILSTASIYNRKYVHTYVYTHGKEENCARGTRINSAAHWMVNVESWTKVCEKRGALLSVNLRPRIPTCEVLTAYHKPLDRRVIPTSSR